MARMTLKEMKTRFDLLYKPFMNRIPLVSRVPRSSAGTLSLPDWQPWGLGVPVCSDVYWGEAEEESYIRLFNLIYLQDMVAGVLRTSPEKAQAYCEGRLPYFEIVESVEDFVGRRLVA